jgi:hypothetical protein
MANPSRIPVIPVEDELLPSIQRNSASDERGYQRIRIRQDTAENWLKNDPILASGEFGFVIGATGLGETLKIGDGTLRWSQLPWLMATGNSGPAGPAGPPGGNMELFIQAMPPALPSSGDLWLQPVSATTANLSIFNGWDWISTATGGGGAAGTINTTAYAYGNPVYSQGSVQYTQNSLAAVASPSYPIQEYIDRLESAIATSRIVVRGGNATLFRANIGTTLTVNGVLTATGGLRYGGTLTPVVTRDGEEDPEPEYTGGFEIPLPTVDGYLRSSDDDNNWYFCEPVVVSENQPGDPKLGEKRPVGTVWINPAGTSTIPDQPFSNTNPPVYLDAPVTEQPNGLSIGISPDGMEIHQPYMIGAVPVMVGGKRYLMPLIEAPLTPPSSDEQPLFTYADDPVTQQLDGTIIGFNDAGTEITQPIMVGGVYVIVGGKKYLLPLIQE